MGICFWQLNEEAAALDWTKRKGHTLNGVRHPLPSEEEFDNPVSLSRKLGGQESGFPSARASSVAAAYHRFANISTNVPRVANTDEEPDPDDSGSTICEEPHSLHAGGKTEVVLADAGSSVKFIDMQSDHYNEVEPDPDDTEDRDVMESESCLRSGESCITTEPYPDDSEELKTEASEESALHNLNDLLRDASKVGPSFSGAMESPGNFNQPKAILVEPDPNDSQATVVDSELAPDDSMVAVAEGISMRQADEPDPDDLELQRIHDPVSAVYGRLQKVMEMLRNEVNPMDATTALQTLLKIIRYVLHLIYQFV